MVTESEASLDFDKVGKLPIENDPNNHFPPHFPRTPLSWGLVYIWLMY